MSEPQVTARVKEIHRREAEGLRGLLQMYLRGDDQLVDEVLNQVFVEVWRKIDRGDDDPGPALLKTIARRRAIDKVREKLNSRISLSATGDLENDHPGANVVAMPTPRDPLAAFLSNEFAAEFWANLRKTGSPHDKEADKARLSRTEYLVLVMSKLDGFSNAEIARRLRLAPGSIGATKSRALSKVRALGVIHGYIVADEGGTTADPATKTFEEPTSEEASPISTQPPEIADEFDEITTGEFDLDFEDTITTTDNNNIENQGPEPSEGEVAHER
ncbi:RNA polymerase sigma factor [Nocardia brasiliensis]|uniref:RNA polymerase sigma factor n=1 Tax=Nocardia brasiliensis TaxID=37326 RepID=UPI00189402D1|nr:sigma-70 family RNA polymerase sigma factor [Nocardia brasiliensis]MBF6548839.1 sigma-70 family RNA polymerase sigma factor [Nocardia brasiliensis]